MSALFSRRLFVAAGMLTLSLGGTSVIADVRPNPSNETRESLQSQASAVPPTPNREALLERFFAPDDRPLVSYRAFRRMIASTRNGRMQAAIEVWTNLSPTGGFTYEITKEEGSAIIRNKVLIAALQAEQAANRADDRNQAALTPTNYDFLGVTPDRENLLKVGVRPRRKHVMLVNGSLFLENESADLVRVEGELSKRPSFWTRRVNIVREYARIEGVHVPVAMQSTADVLVVGSSSFSMTYQYVEINGKPVGGGR